MRRLVLGLACTLALGCNLLSGDEGSDASSSASKRGVKRPLGRPSDPPIPEGPPLVGEPGTDEHGYPLQRPDSTVLTALLRARRFADLDAAFEYYQSQFEADPRKEHWPKQAIGSFLVADENLKPLLDAWIEASPESFAPLAARGAWHDAMGWKLRSNASFRKLTDEQRKGLELEHGHAKADYQRAFEWRPKLLAATIALLQIARTEGNSREEERLYARALVQCRTCVSARSAYVIAQAPRWGGSYPAMDEAAKVDSALLVENPKLGILRGWSGFDKCRTAAGNRDHAVALAQCEAAEAAGPNPRLLCLHARVLNAEERHAEALKLVDRALRLDPQNRECLIAREFARRRTKDFIGAAEDLLVAWRLDPTDEDTKEGVEWMLERLQYDANQAAKAGDAALEGKIRGLADALSPGSGKRRGPAVATNDAIAELQAEVAKSPDDFDLHLKLDAALVSHGRFDDIVKMWDGFIATHPEHAQAWLERGGAKLHGKDKEGAQVDFEKACDLGNDTACRVARARR